MPTLIAVAAAGDPRPVFRRRRDPNRLAAAAVLAVGELEPQHRRRPTGDGARADRALRPEDRRQRSRADDLGCCNGRARPECRRTSHVSGEREDLLTRLIDAEDGIDWDNL